MRKKVRIPGRNDKEKNKSFREDEKFQLTIGLAIRRHIAPTIAHVVVKLSAVIPFFSTIISSNHGSFPARNIISSRSLVRICVHVLENGTDAKENVVVGSIENPQAPAVESKTIEQ